MLNNRFILALGLWVCVLGCRQDMHDQPKYQPYEASAFFADGIASRPAIDGTVARGHLNEDEAFYQGKKDGVFLTYFPVEINRDDLIRGQERYDIFCSPCHDRAGKGRGMVVQRGFKQPPSLHEERILKATPGYLFDVISNGFGTMYSYKARIPTEDRWRIAAYMRALQLSQSAEVAKLSDEDRKKLGSTP